MNKCEILICDLNWVLDKTGRDNEYITGTIRFQYGNYVFCVVHDLDADTYNGKSFKELNEMFDQIYYNSTNKFREFIDGMEIISYSYSFLNLIIKIIEERNLDVIRLCDCTESRHFSKQDCINSFLTFLSSHLNIECENYNTTVPINLNYIINSVSNLSTKEEVEKFYNILKDVVDKMPESERKSLPRRVSNFLVFKTFEANTADQIKELNENYSNDFIRIYNYSYVPRSVDPSLCYKNMYGQVQYILDNYKNITSFKNILELIDDLKCQDYYVKEIDIPSEVKIPKNLEQSIIKVINKNLKHRKLVDTINTLMRYFSDSIAWDGLSEEIVNKVFPKGHKIGKITLGKLEVKHKDSKFDYLFKSCYADSFNYNSYKSFISFVIASASDEDFLSSKESIVNNIYYWFIRQNNLKYYKVYNIDEINLKESYDILVKGGLFLKLIEDGMPNVERTKERIKMIVDDIALIVRKNETNLLYTRFNKFLRFHHIEEFLSVDLGKRYIKIIYEAKLKGDN